MCPGAQVPRCLCSVGALARWRVGALVFLVILCLLTEGCSPEWKRKFIRKKKGDEQGPQPILVLHSGDRALHPPQARYRQRYAFWKSWHAELLISLGQIRKRDLQYLHGVIGELQSMQAILKEGGPAGRLQEIIVELSRLEENWKARRASPWHIPVRERMQLEALQRRIGKEFHASEVLDWIPEPPPGEEAEEVEETPS